MSERLEGISPDIMLNDRSRDSTYLRRPIFSGIFPVKWLWEKFKFFSPTRDVISSGISPPKLLQEKSRPTIYMSVLV
ncbi:hypothetical protein DAI22_01g234201 [Oryza sativa Japonica Group]|nr:hypothetical protein DAI22_01g234201 [Oryza sativa Japonica Group]